MEVSYLVPLDKELTLWIAPPYSGLFSSLTKLDNPEWQVCTSCRTVTAYRVTAKGNTPTAILRKNVIFVCFNLKWNSATLLIHLIARWNFIPNCTDAKFRWNVCLERTYPIICIFIKSHTVAQSRFVGSGSARTEFMVTLCYKLRAVTRATNSEKCIATRGRPPNKSSDCQPPLRRRKRFAGIRSYNFFVNERFFGLSLLSRRLRAINIFTSTPWIFINRRNCVYARAVRFTRNTFFPRMSRKFLKPLSLSLSYICHVRYI